MHWPSLLHLQCAFAGRPQSVIPVWIDARVLPPRPAGPLLLSHRQAGRHEAVWAVHLVRGTLALRLPVQSVPQLQRRPGHSDSITRSPLPPLQDVPGRLTLTSA